MAGSRATKRPVKLPCFDHYGLALRLVKKIREGRTVAATVALAREYARDVWEIDCVYEAAQQVGRSAAQIPRNCAVPVAVIKEWQVATRDLGSGRQWTDRKLANLLEKMYKDVHAAALAEAVRVACAEEAKAKARDDKRKAWHWHRAAANLAAMRRSITDGGCTTVPYPGKSRL